LRQVLNDGPDVQHRAQAGTPRRLVGEQSKQAEVAHDLGAGGGTLDLDHGPLTAAERGPVDLGDGARSQRHRVDGVEDVLPRHAQLLLHHPDDLLLGERGHVVLQGRQLLDERRGQQVRTGRQHLTQLGEGRPQLLQRRAEPPGLSPH
jgi:hypothetical protein